MASSTEPPERLLARSKTIAVVGASKNPEKEAHTVPLFLKEHGYTVVPVNPTADAIFGEKSWPSLAEIPDDLAGRVDVVEVFRPSEELPQVAAQVAELDRRTGRKAAFWSQTGLESDEARRILSENGIPYVMDACMRVVHQVYLSAKR